MGGWEVSVGVSGSDGCAAHSSCLAEAGRLAFWSRLYVTEPRDSEGDTRVPLHLSISIRKQKQQAQPTQAEGS